MKTSNRRRSAIVTGCDPTRDGQHLLSLALEGKPAVKTAVKSPHPRPTGYRVAVSGRDDVWELI
jgi:hypothetical protein